VFNRIPPMSFAAMAAVGLCTVVSLSNADAQVLKDTQQQIAPGFNPNNGNINPGIPVQGPSSSPPGANDRSGEGDNVTNRAAPVDTTTASGAPIPTPEEARAALMSPDSVDAAIGQIAPPPIGGADSAKSAVGDAPSETAKAAQANNNAQSSDAKSPSGDAKSPSDSGGQTAAASPSQDAAKKAAQLTSPNMPIGSTGQTLPAKFSKRNDTLDRLPTMAWPIRLNNEQRHRIYEAVMADKASAASGVDKLKLASQLDARDALNAMHDLPQSLADLGDIKPYKFVKTKDKVLLVTPATRIVTDVITN